MDLDQENLNNVTNNAPKKVNKTVSNTPGCALQESHTYVVRKSLLCDLIRRCVKTT